MLKEVRAFMLGESYWKVLFKNGKELSELDTKPLLIDKKQVRVRAVEWLEDIIGSGDLKNIQEVMLCTPKGAAHLIITEPYTVFQFSRGSILWMGEENQKKVKNCQIIGRIDDKATGAATAYVWDMQEQEGYQLTFNIHDGVPAWRPGVLPIGQLNLTALDVRL